MSSMLPTSFDVLRRVPVRALVAAALLAAVLVVVTWAARTVSESGAASQVTLEVDAERDTTINGIAEEDLSGVRVDTGDLNNDGLADLIIGGRQADPNGKIDAGQTYVLFGPLSPGTLELSTDADITINGIDPGDRSGVGVASGDLNDDGIDDLIIGAFTADPGGRSSAGETYVIFGPLATGTIDLSAAADITVNGIDPNDQSGVGVAGGDFNDDGADDLVIGARTADPNGKGEAGETYVIFGPLAEGTLELSVAAEATINGIDAGDRSGYGLDGGDVNGDGVDDAIIGAWAADPDGKAEAGEAYVLFGPLGEGERQLSTADITVSGIEVNDHLGVGAALEDVNSDGLADLAVGATTADPDGRVDAGEVYLFFGPLEAGTLEPSTDADVVINGIDPSDFFGIGVTASDLNDDGAQDIVVSAFRADPGGRMQAGETYVLFGSTCAGLPATIIGTTGDDVLVGTDEDDVIAGLAGNDVVLGLGGGDTICAGPGSDRISGGDGADLIIGGTGHDLLIGESEDTMHCGAGFDVVLGSSGEGCELQWASPATN